MVMIHTRPKTVLHETPSPGVEIVGRIGRDLITPTQVSNLINSGHHIEQVDTCSFGLELHQHRVSTMIKGPKVRAKKNKDRRLHKGLRP